MTQIVDGKGSGNRLEIDNEGRAVIDAITRPHISHHTLHSLHYDAFNVYFRHSTVATNTDEIVGYIKYLGSEILVIHKLVFSTNSASEVQFELLLGGSGESGGENTIPTNLFVGSNNTLNVTSKDTNDGTSAIAITNVGAEMLDIRIGWQTLPVFIYHTEEAIALGQNNILMVKCKSQGSIGDDMRVNMTYYEEDKR